MIYHPDTTTEPAIDFDYGAIEQEPEPISETERQLPTRLIVCRLLELLCADADALKAGQRAHVLNFLLKNSPHAKKQDLAKALHVTPGRVSQLLKSLDAIITPYIKSGMGAE